MLLASRLAWLQPLPKPGERLNVDYKTVANMTAKQLREQLANYPDVSGVTAMKKDRLVVVLCDKLGIDRHAHAAAGIDKTAIKKQIRSLKKERDAALASKDS